MSHHNTFKIPHDEILAPNLKINSQHFHRFCMQQNIKNIDAHFVTVSAEYKYIKRQIFVQFS